MWEDLILRTLALVGHQTTGLTNRGEGRPPDQLLTLRLAGLDEIRHLGTIRAPSSVVTIRRTHPKRLHIAYNENKTPEAFGLPVVFFNRVYFDSKTNSTTHMP